MKPRIAELDRVYRHRICLALPAAVGLVLAVFQITPPPRVGERPERLAAIAGPLEIHPQIDIAPDPDDPRRSTAAPLLMADPDFVAEDVALVDDPPPVPENEPAPAFRIPDPLASWTTDDLQTEIRTSGLPVLSRTEFEVVHFVRPDYPREARLAGLEAFFEVMLLVSARGNVLETHLVDPGRAPILETEAVRALSQMLFRPYKVNGRPTPFWVTIPVRFTLND
jgi:protein TonB